MTEPRISDIPTIQKALTDIKNISALKAAMPFLRPLFLLLGGDVRKIDEGLNKVADLKQLATELGPVKQ